MVAKPFWDVNLDLKSTPLPGVIIQLSIWVQAVWSSVTHYHKKVVFVTDDWLKHINQDIVSL